MPIIFAQSIIAFPGTLAALFPGNEVMQFIHTAFSPGRPIYIALYGLMIMFFTYFYTAVVFDPEKIADEIKKNGGFIPGIRPGKATSDYLSYIITRITLVGALFLGLIAILPSITQGITGITALTVGGTGILIVVSVILETSKQVEGMLVMRNYESFLDV